MKLDFSQIDSIQTLAQYLGYSKELINNFIIDEGAKDIEIIKLNHNGKIRLVADTFSTSYSNILKAIQEYLYSNYKPDEVIIGYVKGKNIADNAKIHLNQNFLLKADIKDFFYSISDKSIEKCFVNMGINSGLSHNLSKLVTYQGILYPGLCTSPILSNIYLIDMDKDFLNLSKVKDCKYSRYADDITFSATKQSSLPTHDEIQEIFNKYGFTINETKFSISKKGQNQIVTGLSISDEQYPRIPRKIKIKIKTA